MAHDDRIAKLESSHDTLADSLSDLRESFVIFRAEAKSYARAGLFVFGIIHPVIVGLIVYVATRG